MSSSSPYYDVIIVGAGPAGLAAARELNKNRLSVCVLESRARVGGRTYTSTALGVPLDMGASWMHHYNKHHPFYKMAKDKGAGLGEGCGGFRLFDQDGSIVDRHTLDRVRKVYIKLMNYAESVGNKLKMESGEMSSDETIIDKHSRIDPDSDIDDLDINDPWTDNTRSNDISVESAIAQERARLTSTWNDRDQRTLSYFISGEEQFEAATMDKMSLKHWCSGDGDVECDMFVQTGYGSLVADLAQGIDIKLETRVTKIQYQQNHVIVTTQHCDNIETTTNPASTTGTSNAAGTTTQTYQAAYVIVTVPLGILKKRLIEFDPPLPVWKSAVIDRMGWGLMNKVIIQFPTPFWGNLASIGHAGSSHGDYRWFLSLSEPLNASFPQHEQHNNILMCLVTCQQAWELEENKSDKEIVDECMTVLRGMFEKGKHDDSKQQHVNDTTTTTADTPRTQLASSSSASLPPSAPLSRRQSQSLSLPQSLSLSLSLSLSQSDSDDEYGSDDDTTRGTELEQSSTQPHVRYDRIPQPIAYLVTRWGSDPHAMGSYSHFSTSSHPNDCLLLAKHINHTVYFAGEACHKHTIGCVDSAYLSGVLQAKRIYDHISSCERSIDN